jgi:hypothetical protein
MEKSKTNVDAQSLMKILETRFESNPHRHRGVTWKQVEVRLKKAPKKLAVLLEMERTDGEPDVVDVDTKSGAVTFMDCSLQSPKARRSVCYDQAAWDSRKEFKPKNGNAITMAETIGATILTEEQYLFLQSLQDVDTTTSSWLLTPKSVRELGGGLFGDKRFGRAFVFHNGVESYYADRGFRTVLVI